MNPSTPPTLKQLKALGYSDEKFIALNALKNRSLIVNKSENFDSQCRNVIIDYAKTVTAASNLMEVIENAQEIDKVVDELYILKLAASKEQEKLDKIKLQEQEMLKQKQQEEKEAKEILIKQKIEQQRKEQEEQEKLKKIIESAKNNNNANYTYRRPSRPAPSLPRSLPERNSNNDLQNIMIIEKNKKEIKIKISNNHINNNNRKNTAGEKKKKKKEIGDVLFDRIDKDNNGLIDREEFGEAVENAQAINALTSFSLTKNEKPSQHQEEEEEEVIVANKKLSIEELESEIDFVFGQFEGLKRLTMIMGIADAIHIVERANVIQNAIIDNNSNKNVATMNKDIELLRNDVNILQKLVTEYTS